MKLFRSLCALFFGIAIALPGHAAIGVRDSAELFLVVWDPVAKVSYSKDLGLNTYYGSDLELRKNSFFVYAQQDAGFQRFWTLDVASDANYQQFRSVASSVSNMLWAVIGIDTDDDAAYLAPGGVRTFVTLRSGDTQGIVNPHYAKLTGLINDEFRNASLQFESVYISALNNRALPPNVNFNSHSPDPSVQNDSINGSSFDAEGQAGYFGVNGGLFASFDRSCACLLTNPVGKSSWFYYATSSDEFDNFAPVAVDEFDNLSHDAYWGVAQNPADGKLVLSFTLAASAQRALATTAAGKARASLTEYSAGATERFIASPMGEFAHYATPAVTPVPEPASLLLWAVGGLGLAWRQRASLRPA